MAKLLLHYCCVILLLLHSELFSVFRPSFSFLQPCVVSTSNTDDVFATHLYRAREIAKGGERGTLRDGGAVGLGERNGADH